MKKSIWTRVIALGVALQFINVQTQLAFGVESVVQETPEYQAALSQALDGVEKGFQGKSEKYALKKSYRLYRKLVKLTNVAASQSEARKEAMKQELSRDADTIVAVSARDLRKEKRKEDAEAFLTKLSTPKTETGEWVALNPDGYAESVTKLAEAQAAPVFKLILKVVLTLLVLIGGGTAVIFGFAILSLGGIFGGTVNPIIYLVIAGGIVAAIYGIKGIWASIQRNSLPKGLEITA